MKSKIHEWFSIKLVKHPGRMVLACILIVNLLFFLLSALIISALSLDGTEKMGFIRAAFCTITMILDAGCIQFVINDIGTSGVVVTLFCLFVIIFGMIFFTGSVIGYVTNSISSFIANANAGKRKLKLNNHFVILNWNNRASEIINDMLYSEKKQKVVVLVQTKKDEVEKEIDERLSDTIQREKRAIIEKYSHLPFMSRHIAYYRNRFDKKVTVIVREGDVFSSKQLHDIALDKARAIIILCGDVNNSLCKFENKERVEELSRGNSQTIKTLMQVSDITSEASSADDQRIIVEATDEWTAELVDKIIAAKQVKGKCNIIPVRVNEILGQILSQFCLMPELNQVYSELFSNKGARFFSFEQPPEDEVDFAKEYLANHNSALPVTTMQKDDTTYAYYVALSYKDIDKKATVQQSSYKVSLNKDYWIERKNIIILGHNSKCRDLMAGFAAFRSEWELDDENIVEIIVIDDKKSLEKMNYYRDYPFVIDTIEAEIYDKDLICSTIERFVSAHEEDTSILILSDDAAPNEYIDASAFANLVYVRDIIDRKIKENPDFDPESIDVIVEIINPKHHDIVNRYSVNNVVISNRYISKMITQISEFEALFDFYKDILTFDLESSEDYNSKEVYIKDVRSYFTEVPGETTADKFVRAVFEASVEADNPSIVLGYVQPGGNVVIFSGNLTEIPVKLSERDKLILFSSH